MFPRGRIPTAGHSGCCTWVNLSWLEPSPIFKTKQFGSLSLPTFPPTSNLSSWLFPYHPQPRISIAGSSYIAFNQEFRSEVLGLLTFQSVGETFPQVHQSLTVVHVFTKVTSQWNVPTGAPITHCSSCLYQSHQSVKRTHRCTNHSL